MSRLLLFLYAAQAIAAVDFARDVEPILTARCHGCHGERTQMKGLRLDNRDDALRVLSPGKSAESLLLRMVSGTEEKRVMPPAGARLTSTEIGMDRRRGSVAQSHGGGSRQEQALVVSADRENDAARDAKPDMGP